MLKSPDKKTHINVKYSKYFSKRMTSLSTLIENDAPDNDDTQALDTNANGTGLSTPAIIGIVIGVVSFIAIIVSIIYFISKRKTNIRSVGFQQRYHDRLGRGGAKMLNSMWKKIKKMW